MDHRLSNEIDAQVAVSLLSGNHGINLNETYLCDDRCLELLIASGEHFYVAINDIADESDLDRIDSRFSFKATLRIADEIAVMKELLGKMVIGEVPVTCGKCVSRTDL